MAENETASAVEEQGQAGAEASVEEAAEDAYQYDIKIEDAGPATKKVAVEIPEDRISEKLKEQFKEVRREAVLPGFRPGHAPQKLVEKRFATDVREQVRRQLMSESYEQALKRNNLQVLGEPEFENAAEVKLPETGSLKYAFSVEVQPEITLPELKGLKVKKPKIEVKDENVDQAMLNLREQQGTLVPVEGRGVESRDYLTADVHVKVEGNVVTHQHDAPLVARPGRVAGVQVDDLDKQLEGLKPGETRTLTVKAPDTHANEALRGKEVQVEVALKDIKKLELPEVNKDFLDGLGFETEAELREALREQMVERIEEDVKQSMREQVNRYLLDNVQMDLPTKMSDRQADRVVSRRTMELMMRGVPREQVEAAIEQLRGGAKDEAARELKLFFILQKVAEQQNVEVDEAELNGRIAMLAAQRGRRPEKVKQDMAKDGSLASLYVQLRDEKALNKVLEQAEFEEVDVEKTEGKPA